MSCDLKSWARLITTNALSLVFGVVANASILLVAGDGDGWRANYDLQLIIGTIIGGIVASTILIALVVTASVQFNRPSSPSFSFTEAFYYAIISGVLYIITSSFIIYTAHRLWHLSKEERAEIQIAKGHRRLMRLTVIFMAYILLGAAVFFHVEGWRYLDAVYWADVTILTIGFGDFKPLTTLGRALLIPYATGGIFILFLVIYCVPKLVFERGGSMWEIHLRDQERIKSVRKREKEEPVKNAACHDRSSSRNAAEERNNFVNCEDIGQTPRALGSYIDEREMRRRDFILMQDILRRSTRKRFLYSVILWGSSLLFLWLVGATCFFALERSQGWTYFDAVYFAFTAISVIGYDDRTLFTNSGKAFFVMWSLIVVPTLTMLIATAVEAVGHPYVAAQIPYMDARENRVGRKIIGNIPSKEDERLSSECLILPTYILEVTHEIEARETIKRANSSLITIITTMTRITYLFRH
jgi:potassium channel subfamily K